MIRRLRCRHKLDAVARPRPLPSQNAAVYSHLLPGAGPHQPVIEGAIPLRYLPAEYTAIECGGALRVVGMDFKMNYSGHISIIGAVGGYRFLLGCGRGCGLGGRGQAGLERSPQVAWIAGKLPVSSQCLYVYAFRSWLYSQVIVILRLKDSNSFMVSLAFRRGEVCISRKEHSFQDLHVQGRSCWKILIS